MLCYFHLLLRQTERLSRRGQIVRRRPLAILAVTFSAVLVATIGYAVRRERPRKWTAGRCPKSQTTST